MLVQVRPSNQALLRARVPGAQHQHGCFPVPLRVLSPSLFRGAAKSALECAHRTIYMLTPSLLVPSSGMGSD